MDDRDDDQFNEGAPSDEEVTAVEELRAAGAHDFNQDLVTRMGDALGESETVEALAAAAETVFMVVLGSLGHHAFPDKQLNKRCVRALARGFKDKVEDLVDTELAEAGQVGAEDGQARGQARGQVLKRVLDVVFDAIAARLAGPEAAAVHAGAARLALKLITEILKGSLAALEGLTVTQSVESVAVSLLTFLLDSHAVAASARQAEELLFSWLYVGKGQGAKGLVQHPNYKLFLRNDLPPGRLTILGRCLSELDDLEEGAREAIEQELVNCLETIVLHDETPLLQAKKNVIYFQTFLKAASKDVIEEKVLPRMQFISNRAKGFIGINAKLISFMKNYKIESEDSLRRWMDDLLSEELLMTTGDEKEEVAEFVKSVFGICSEAQNMKHVLVVDVLIGKFKEAKRGGQHVSQAARHRLLHIVQELVTSDQGNQEVSRELLQVALEHFYQLREAADAGELVDLVCKFAEMAEPLDCKDVLLPLIQKQPKILFGSQVQPLLDLFKASTDQAALKEIDQKVSGLLAASLTSENFRSTQNASNILSLSAFFCLKMAKLEDPSGVELLISNDSTAKYLMSSAGFVNTPAFIEAKKGISHRDVQNQMITIEALIKHHFDVSPLKPPQFSCLLNTLCESLLSLGCVFREGAVLSCFQNLQHLGSKFTTPLFKTMFEKVTQVCSRPAPRVGEDERLHAQSLMIGKKVEFVIKMLYNRTEGPAGSASRLEKEEFFLLLRTICHPYVSAKSKDLMSIMTTLTDVLDKQAELAGNNRELTLPSYFQQYSEEIIQYALVQRSGILSPNETLREIGKNMLICLGWQGYLADYIGRLVTLLDYKPVELTVKLRDLIEKEAGAIGPYDMIFYSEVSKDLQKLLGDKDQEIARHEIETTKAAADGQGGEGAASEEQIVEKKAEPKKAMTPAQMQALLMKQKTGKGKKGGKPGAKGGKPGGAAKPQAPPPKKEEAKQEEAVVDKETRRRMDTEQLLSFCDQIQQVKARHVQTVWEVLRIVNQMKEVNILNYQDITLKHTIVPALRLLNYKCSRFSTFYFLQNLFMDNRQSPFYGIRGPLMGCLLCVQENKVYQRTVHDFQKFFEHIRQTADFSDMDAGYLQMILALANFVLQNLEVNLSVKEAALNVAQEILDTNPRVRNLDLVRLTINMMKSNYIGKTLSSYLSKLIRRLSPEELAVMLQRLFDFDPIARQKFLNEILVQSEPLFCPVWFSTQMWILQFDDDFFSVSRKIWNRYGLVLRSGVLDISQEKQLGNIYLHLRTSNTAVFDMTVKAAVAAIEILQSRYDAIVDDLLKFYHSEIVVVRQLNLDALKRTGDENNFEGNKRFNRIALPLIIEQTSKFIPHSSVQKLLDFFVMTGSVDSDPAVSAACLRAADAVVHARGADYAGKMLQILERFVEEADGFRAESVHHAIVLIGTLSDYLDKGGQKKLVQTFEKLLLLLMRPGGSELVNKSICKCIPKLSRFFEERTKQIFNDQLGILRTGKAESELRGAAYACAGIIKGCGMKFFKERDVIGVLQRECFAGKKADPLRLLAGLQLYETLSFAQGKAFEPYIKQILPNIMNCIADPREQVRICANRTNTQILRNFSSYAIKQVVPIFLEGLLNDNWRAKLAAVEAVGDMAFCAPKQMLGFLPDIVKALREVLNDTHEKVHEAALQAISKIGSVIKCPEVAELLDIIIKALGNSNLYLNDCLDALLSTSFVHAIDAPSLSLLIPLVDIGLTRHDNSSKQAASKLVGNICSLTQDPEDLLPYMKILIPAIKNSLFDSIPEVRASAAKALGQLSRGLGLANSIELLEWLNSNLHRKDLAASERSGAAQGLSEVVSAHGDNFFSNQCKEIMALAKSKETFLRESYRTVMAYLPTSFPNFVNYLVVMLPIMIEGLADESEEVMKVSLRNVKICIQQYGKKASELLCQPILAMMFDKDARVRMSSSILMYQLVKEMENDIIKIQPKYINLQMKYQILSAMFILKFDPIDKVQVQASQIWKSLVDAPVHILRMIIETLIRMVFTNIQSPHEELQEMGLACLRGLVEKFGERIVNESLDIFEGYLEEATDLSQTSGINRVILNMAGAASHRLLLQIKGRLTSIADPFLVADDKDIRELAAKVYLTVFKRLGDPAYTQSMLEAAFLQKLHGLMQGAPDAAKTREIERLIGSVKFMLEQAPELKVEDKIMTLCGVPAHSLRTPLTTAQAVILRAIAPQVAPLVFSKKYYHTLFAALSTELTNDPLDPADANPERMQALLMCFAEVVACIPDAEYAAINDEILEFHEKCLKRQTYGLYVDLIEYYCQHTASNYEKHAKFYTTNVLRHMNSTDKVLVGKVVSGVTAIFARLPKETQFSLVPLIRDAIEEIAVEDVDEHLGPCIYRRKVKSINMLETKEGVKTLAAVIQNSIMHGSIKIRVDSAYCFKYLIDFASPAAIKMEVIKICGALIRVVNDKFSPDLKLQIFLSLRLMLVKAAAMVRAMVAQLQTTFLKAFADSQSNDTVRQVVVENLLLLVKMTAKADPIVKDLTAQLDGEKIDGEQKVQVSQALALVLREKGKAVQEAISKQVYQVLTSIIEERKQNVNDKVIVNAAVALGFLSAYSSGPAQMRDLFAAYDEEGDYRVSLGIKLSILMNGSAKIPDLQELQAATAAYISGALSSESGIVEIDGRDISDGRPDEEIFRFDGALDALAHIMNTYQRRCYKADSVLSKLVFTAITQSKLFEKLNAEEDFSAMSKVYTQIPAFITALPIPSLLPKPAKLPDELAAVMRDSFTFLHKFYLDFESKKDGKPALLNLLQLTYNHTLDLGVGAGADEVTPLSTGYVRDTVCELPQLQGIIPNDMKVVCNDIIFAQE